MTKSLVRSGNRRGVRDDKSPRVVGHTASPREPAACERCGATFVRRTWRRGRPTTTALLARVTWTVCPACTQSAQGEYFGRVVIGGGFAAEHDAAIRARIANVDVRARFTQPERRVIAGTRAGDTLEVLTTSQKLAHRIVHELKKAFRGRATYQWSDKDGSLFATWHRD